MEIVKTFELSDLTHRMNYCQSQKDVPVDENIAKMVYEDILKGVKNYRHENTYSDFCKKEKITFVSSRIGVSKECIKTFQLISNDYLIYTRSIGLKTFTNVTDYKTMTMKIIV